MRVNSHIIPGGATAAPLFRQSRPPRLACGGTDRVEVGNISESCRGYEAEDHKNLNPDPGRELAGGGGNGKRCQDGSDRRIARQKEDRQCIAKEDVIYHDYK